MESDEPSARCDRVTKAYRGRVALAETDVSFFRGATAVLGPNGAGKTSLLSMIATVTSPTSGVVTVASIPIDSAAALDRARTRIGYLPQRFDVIGGATVQENVAYACWVHGSAAADVGARTDRALRAVGLDDRAGDRARILSGGQRQRLGIACAVAHEPSVLILDEPSVGLDPIQRASLRTLIAQLASRSAVLLSTHLVDEAVQLGDRTVVLKEGHVVFDGRTASLIAGAPPTGERIRALEAALMGLLE